MKRDMELVREILVRVEELPLGGIHHISVEGYSREEIVYHVMLLDEAGLIEAEDCSSNDGIDWLPRRLTYAGHEFLDSARSTKVWQEAKSWMLKTTGVLTIEGLKLALPEVTKRLMH